MKKKKKKFTLKKVKKLFVNLWKKVLEKLKELKDKFMALPDVTRKIIYIWGGVVVIVFILIFASYNNGVFLDKYYAMEKSMNASALDYVESNELYPVSGSKLKLDLEVMKEYNYIYEEDIADKSCEGFALVYYDDIDEEYVVDSYINCNKYTTKGYADYK